MGTFGKVSKSLGLALISVGAFAVPQSAQAGCAQTYRICMINASDLETFWERTAAGVDCGIEFAGCVRRAVFG
jgi:hypothetical protein